MNTNQTRGNDMTDQTQQQNTLQKKAMLVSMRCKSFPNKVKDRAVTREVQQKHSAQPRTGDYAKNLISPDILKPITRIDYEMRSYHAHTTLPWEQGIRLLPSVQHMEYSRHMQEFVAARESAVNVVATNWVWHVEQSIKMLGSMGNLAEYPSADDFKRVHTVDIRIDPVPAAGHFMLEISESELARLEGDLETSINERLSGAMQEVSERLENQVRHIAEKLSKEPGLKEGGTFRNSLIGNLAELLKILPALNITGDEKLTALAREAEERLLKDPAVLRGNNAVRTETAEAAGDILERFSGYGRKGGAKNG